MEKIIIEVSNEADISFIGKLVAQEHESGMTISVYETQKGAWFIAFTNNFDTLIRQIIIKNKSTDELIEALGYTDYSKRIYNNLNIDTTKKLDI